MTKILRYQEVSYRMKMLSLKLKLFFHWKTNEYTIEIQTIERFSYLFSYE